jgi:hypothetical protein
MLYRLIASRWLPYYDKGLDACSLEAMACRDGAKFVAQLGIQRVVIETDCLQVVQLWNKVETQLSIIDSILQEIDELRLLSRIFSFFH